MHSKFVFYICLWTSGTCTECCSSSSLVTGQTSIRKAWPSHAQEKRRKVMVGKGKDNDDDAEL